MGAENTKPTNVSDAAWERVQTKKLNMIAEERDRIAADERQKVRGLTNLASNYAEYCSACNDIPKLLMFFPLYRERCSKAREKLFKDVSEIAVNTYNNANSDEIINQIKRL